MNTKDDHKDPIYPGTSRDSNHFKVPPTYFAELHDKIRDKLDKETQTSASGHLALESPWHWIMSLLTPRPALAMLTVLFLVGFFVTRNQKISKSDGFALSQEEITEYLEQNLDDLEISDLYLLDTEGMDPISSSIYDEDFDPYLENLIQETDMEILEEIF